MLLAQTQVGMEALILLGITIALLGLLAPFFIWVNVRGLRRENRKQLEAIERRLSELVDEQRSMTRIVKPASDQQKN